LINLIDIFSFSKFSDFLFYFILFYFTRFYFSFIKAVRASGLHSKNHDGGNIVSSALKGGFYSFYFVSFCLFFFVFIFILFCVGTLDPFIQVKVGSRKLVTKPKFNTQNPVWESEQPFVL
jgi:hypothetical protein